jgi:hypothetical protein
MKVKRYKHARKTIAFYKSRFGLHEPFPILGEPITFSETMPPSHMGQAGPVTSTCQLFFMLTLRMRHLLMQWMQRSARRP